MNIVLAPDSFKESITATQATDVMEQAILDLNKNHQTVKKPMADGGEGTIDVFLTAAGGERISIHCTGPLGNEIETSYVMSESKQAVIELASVAGLEQVPNDKRNPDHTTSRGLGEVILDALDKGSTSIIIGLGGSATNDGGLGMLIALGMEAWDKNGNKLEGFGRDVQRVSKVSFDALDSRLQEIEIKVASDVDNPLCGEDGASAVFGPQKGATPEQVQAYDQALEKYSDLIEAEVHREMKEDSKTGAAGGLGFALKALGAALVSGAELIAKTLGLEEAIQKADLVITGEGKSDQQTLNGKVPGFVASLANKYGIPVILLSGSVVGNREELQSHFLGSFSIANQPMTLEESMENTRALLYEQTKQIVHLIDSIGSLYSSRLN